MLKQMEHLVHEKGKLKEENAKLCREMQRMQELLTMFTLGGEEEEGGAGSDV